MSADFAGRAARRIRARSACILGRVRERRRISIAAVVAAAALACAGCGQSGQTSSATASTATSTTTSSRHTPQPQADAPTYRVHPRAVEPVAGQPAADVGTGVVRAGRSGIPRTAGVSVSTPDASLPQPQSEAEIRRELAQSGMTGSSNQATLTSGRLAIAPIGAPAAVQEVIAAGNQIAHLPYVWGGGHMTYEDTGYDCSGSLSYVLAAAHLLSSTVTSGQLEHWGKPGPGKWITVFANAGHTFMYVAGLRFDTVALAETGSRWSNRSADEPDIRTFAVRHPAGL